MTSEIQTIPREFQANMATWLPVVSYLAGRNTLATQRTYKSVLRSFLASGDVVNLPGVTQNTVLAYKASMLARGLSPRTIRHHLIVLSSFFTWAIVTGYHPGPNPAANVPLPRVGGSLAGIAIDQGELESLLDAARTGRDRALLHLLAATGLRASEACALQQRDLHFPGIDRVAIQVRNGKGGKSRTVTVASMALSVDLTAYLIQRRYCGPTTWLFQALDGRAAAGKPLSRHTLYKLVKRVAGWANLDHLTPHDLRRTYATISLDLGVPLPIVQERMAHRRMSQTAEYYRAK